MLSCHLRSCLSAVASLSLGESWCAFLYIRVPRCSALCSPWEVTGDAHIREMLEAYSEADMLATRYGSLICLCACYARAVCVLCALIFYCAHR